MFPLCGQAHCQLKYILLNTHSSFTFMATDRQRCLCTAQPMPPALCAAVDTESQVNLQAGMLCGSQHSCKFTHHSCLSSLFWMSWVNQLSRKLFRVRFYNWYKLPKLFVYTQYNASVRAMAWTQSMGLNGHSEISPHASLDQFNHDSFALNGEWYEPR